MAYPEDLVGNHEVWASLSDLSDGLANAESSARGEDIEVKAVRNIERLRDVVDHLEQVLNAADPSLVSSDSLDSINQHVTRATVQVDKFTNSINVGNLQSANSHIDNALQAAAALWAPRSAADLEGLRQRLTRFRKSAGQLSANLKSDVQEARELAERVKEEAEQTQENLRSKVESKLNQLKETADETRNNIEDKYASQLEQLEERIAQHKEEVQAQKERLEKAISEHQSQFSEAQESRRKSFVEEQEGRKEEFQKLTVELEEDMTSTLERAKLRVDNIYAGVSY